VSSDSVRFRWLDAIVGKEGRVGPIGASVRHAALTLAAFMDEAGKCWPSLTTLAKAMQRDRSTVIRSLNKLELQGWIKRKRGRSAQPTVYWAVIPVVASDDTPSGASATQ